MACERGRRLRQYAFGNNLTPNPRLDHRYLASVAITFNAPTLLGLLTNGYFPRELPPPFVTGPFAAYAVALAATWDKQSWTSCAAHNLARPGGLRRPLRIPNPISYVRLAEQIVDNWIELRNHTWNVRLSATRPQVLKVNRRAITPR